MGQGYWAVVRLELFYFEGDYLPIQEKILFSPCRVYLTGFLLNDSLYGDMIRKGLRGRDYGSSPEMRWKMWRADSQHPMERLNHLLLRRLSNSS